VEIGNPVSTLRNGFNYAAGNPIQQRDPSGLHVLDLTPNQQTRVLAGFPIYEALAKDPDVHVVVLRGPTIDPITGNKTDSFGQALFSNTETINITIDVDRHKGDLEELTDTMVHEFIHAGQFYESLSNSPLHRISRNNYYDSLEAQARLQTERIMQEYGTAWSLIGPLGEINPSTNFYFTEDEWVVFVGFDLGF